MKIQDKEQSEYQQQAERDTFSKCHLEIMVHRQKCSIFDAAFWLFTFLSDSVPFVKVFIHPLSYLRSTTKPDKGESDMLFIFHLSV